ncbi:MAG: phage holin family protein [Verrucomicrobiota bacterium]
MQRGWIEFLQRWLVITVGVLVAAQVVPGIRYDTLSSLLVASLLLGLLNAFVRPVLLLLSLPLVVFTFGIGFLVINALLFWGVGFAVRGFQVAGFWPAFWGALVVSATCLLVSVLLGRGPRMETRRGPPPPPPPGPPAGQGPVIDV